MDRPDDSLTDEELTALALAGDPDQPLDDDAVPLADYLRDERVVTLPAWYMPVAARQSDWRWRRGVVLVVVLAFVLIEASGLCSTYGQLVFG